MEETAWNILYYIWFQQVFKIFVVKPFQNRLILIHVPMLHMLSNDVPIKKISDQSSGCVYMHMQRLSMDDYQAKCEFL